MTQTCLRVRRGAKWYNGAIVCAIVVFVSAFLFCSYEEGEWHVSIADPLSWIVSWRDYPMARGRSALYLLRYFASLSLPFFAWFGLRRKLILAVIPAGANALGAAIFMVTGFFTAKYDLLWAVHPVRYFNMYLYLILFVLMLLVATGTLCNPLGLLIPAAGLGAMLLLFTLAGAGPAVPMRGSFLPGEFLSLLAYCGFFAFLALSLDGDPNGVYSEPSSAQE